MTLFHGSGVLKSMTTTKVHEHKSTKRVIYDWGRLQDDSKIMWYKVDNMTERPVPPTFDFTQSNIGSNSLYNLVLIKWYSSTI